MILVTGGAGYVGSHFVREYSRRKGGSELLVIDNLCEGHEKAITSAGVRLVNCSIGDQETLSRIFSEHKIDSVVHFAANAYVGESQENPFKYLHNNVVQSINLFEAMERHHVRRIVFSSTCATYGAPEYVPLDEKHPQRPVNVYGNTKLMIEQILHSLADAKSWSFVALRYFNAAGADQDGDIGESHDPEPHIIPRALKAGLGQLTHVDILGDDYDTRDGTCIRDYIHVTDLAAAHISALELLETKQIRECINLGTEYGASVKEVVNICGEVTGRAIPSRVAPRRSGDPPVLVANSTKAKTVLGWQPKYDLRQIVETAWKWEQNRRY
jgi:UDP-glucose-4-epimerase GalE